MTDLQLLERYRQWGDRVAFDRLVERYYALVLRVCRRQLRNDADADDAAQQVFWHLLSQAPQVHSNLAAWLHRCAHNVSVSLVRSSLARRRTEQAYLESGWRSRADEPDADLLLALDDCLATMSDRDRELIIQTQLLRVPQRVLASERGVSQQAVAKQLARSMDLLRTAISARGFAITAAALVAALEGEASAALISLGAAGTVGAAPHFVSGTATALATTTKLKLVCSAVAGLALLTLPGTPDRVHDAAPPGDRTVAEFELARSADWLAAAPLPAASDRIAAGVDGGWADEPAPRAAPEDRRRVMDQQPAGRTTTTVAAAPIRRAVPRIRETGVSRPQQHVARVAPPIQDWPDRELSPWRPGVETAVPQAPAPLAPAPTAAPSVVRHAHPGNALGSGAPPVKPSPASIATGGSATGSLPPGSQPVAGGPIADPSTGVITNPSKPSNSSISSSKPSAPRPSAPSTASGGVAHNVPITSKPPSPSTGIVLGTNRIVPPPPHGMFPDSQWSISPHGAPPPITGSDLGVTPSGVVVHVERSAYQGDFLLSIDEPRSVGVAGLSEISQLSYTSLRMGSAVIDPFVVTSTHFAAPGADFGLPGVSPRALAQITGDDPYDPLFSLAAVDDHRSVLQLTASGDPYNLLGFCDNTTDPAAAWFASANGGDFDPAAMYATQIATVPEPAAWLLVLLAALAMLLTLARRDPSRSSC